MSTPANHNNHLAPRLYNKTRFAHGIFCSYFHNFLILKIFPPFLKSCSPLHFYGLLYNKCEVGIVQKYAWDPHKYPLQYSGMVYKCICSVVYYICSKCEVGIVYARNPHSHKYTRTVGWFINENTVSVLYGLLYCKCEEGLVYAWNPQKYPLQLSGIVNN